MKIIIKIIIATAKITIIRKYTVLCVKLTTGEKSQKNDFEKIIECFLYDEEFFASCCLVCQFRTAGSLNKLCLRLGKKSDLRSKSAGYMLSVFRY